MTTLFMLLLIALAVPADSEKGKAKRHANQELLVRSKRRWVLSTIELSEEEPGPYPRIISRMFNIKADEESGYHKFLISGMGVTEEPLGVFSIDEHNGWVYVHKAVDREKYQSFHIMFDIVNKLTNQKIDQHLAFDVDITDVNDNAPEFSPIPPVDVKENLPEGYLPVTLNVHDRDQEGTPNSEFNITMISQTPQEPKIALKQLAGGRAILGFKGCFDYDKIKSYEIKVQAEDHGKPSFSSTAVVILNIVDANTHPPVFKKRKYQAEIFESTTQKDILRIEVEDKDTPKTPGWRAKYFFIQGNEEGSFQIETDPDTNAGILNLIKGKDFETASQRHLEIGVENEEPLFVCKDQSKGPVKPPDSVTVTIKVKDVNDPPRFEKDTAEVYCEEEEEPGKLLFTPKVFDDDSEVSKIRYVLLNDPANWVEIDPKTGQITSIVKMDRESPFVKDNIYNISIGAIDDGDPPATGICTVLVNLRDINDNPPELANRSVIMCGNKDNKVSLTARDSDEHPYSGPFVFSLTDDEQTLWKLVSAIGEEGKLVSLKTLPYGDYPVPLMIQDQQGKSTHDTVTVTVCDCGKAAVCPPKKQISSGLGAPAIGLIIAGLLLFLLLLLLFMCQCAKDFYPIPIVQDENNQSLIKYNQEAGGVACTAGPTLLFTPNGVVTSDQKWGTRQDSRIDGAMSKGIRNTYNISGDSLNNFKMPTLGMHQMDSLTSLGGQSKFSLYMRNRTNTYQNGSSGYQRSFSLQSKQHIADQLDKRLQTIGNHDDYQMYQPHKYAFEGEGSKCHSLDKLSLSSQGDNMQCMNDFGPKFNTLSKICHQTIQEKNIQL